MIRRAWRWFLAVTRLDLTAVCEMSNGGAADYHDYPDDGRHPVPMHFHAYRCSRCGKTFGI